MVTKDKELVIEGITEQQLREIISDELDKFKLQIAEVLVAASKITKNPKELLAKCKMLSL
jgi:hypothetical protein